MLLTPDDRHPDRRRIGRTTAERRDFRTRLEGLWTEAERQRVIRTIREERRDARAVTIHAGEHREHPKVTDRADGVGD
jgi:hypothetical protein